jgi:hypothetical protein
MLDDLSDKSTQYGFFENPDPQQYQSNGLYFHGVEPADSARQILEDGEIKSYDRVMMDEGENPYTPIIEDLLRIEDIGYHERDLDFIEALDQYEDKLMREGTEATRETLSDPEAMETVEFLAQTPAFEFDVSGRMQGTWRSNAVSVGHLDTNTPFLYGEEGAVFELTLPESAVHQNQEVPGSIPLEYARAMYLGPNLDSDERDELSNHTSVQQHGLEVKEFSDFDY